MKEVLKRKVDNGIDRFGDLMDSLMDRFPVFALHFGLAVFVAGLAMIAVDWLTRLPTGALPAVAFLVVFVAGVIRAVVKAATWRRAPVNAVVEAAPPSNGVAVLNPTPGRRERWIEAQLDPDGDVEQQRARLEALWDAVEPTDLGKEERRARHEAAHVLVAHHMGCVVLSASIRQTDDTGGSADIEAPHPVTQGQASWIRLVYAVAAHTHDLSHGVRDIGSMFDIRTVDMAAAGVISADYRPAGYTGEMTIAALTTHARQVATGILATHSGQHRALTDALLDREALNGAEIRNILTVGA